MRKLFWYLFGFSALVPAAVASPLVSLNDGEVVNAVANQPVVGSPDPRFKIDTRFDGPKLPLISCLMSTVDLLMILSLQNFWGSMEETAWVIEDYPEVGMVISPIMEGGNMDTRFVIWGLSDGAAHMIHLNRFQAVTFTLYWEGEKVGTIRLEAWPTTQSQDTHTNMTEYLTQHSNSSRPVLPKYSVITTKNVQDQRLTVRAALIGSTVPLFDVFLVVMAVLVDAAALGATERLESYVSSATAAGVRVTFKKPVPARSSPPFFEVQWLLKTVASIPEFMITKGVFQELALIVEIDHVRVADGSLKSSVGRIGPMNVNSNVTVS